jgi:hypothetical protein
VTEDFARLEKETTLNLWDFLKIEVELGFTFASLARTHAGREHFKASMRNAEKALAAIDYFKTRLPLFLRADIDRRRADLAEVIAATQGA